MEIPDAQARSRSQFQDQDVVSEPPDAPADGTKDVWVKPEITEFKPVTVARGISYRIGDGISNLC
jgi:hypothetical protein